MFMTPGLALFYDGKVRPKSVLNTMALTVACLGVVSVIWVAFGYSLVFGKDQSGGLVGDLAQSGLHGLPTALAGAVDVVAVHGIGGLTGLPATTAVNAAGANGLSYGGGTARLGPHPK